MAGADGGNRPQLSFRWDWGCGPFWCGNDAARATATVPRALLHRYEAMLVAVLRGVRIDAPR